LRLLGLISLFSLQLFRAEAAPSKDFWINLHLQSNPTQIFPYIQNSISGNEVASYIFDSLLWLNPRTGKLEPRLATKWEVSEDGKRIDFWIREDVKFHDGKPLTVKDIAFSFNLIKDLRKTEPQVESKFTYFENVREISKKQIRLYFNQPYFRNLAMAGLARILPAHIYSSQSLTENPKVRTPLGSGPYKFVSWNAGQSIELKAFDDFWGKTDKAWKDRAQAQGLRFKIILDRNVASLATRKSEIDRLTPLPRDFLKQFDEAQFHKLNYDEPLGTDFIYIVWNTRRKPFDSKIVRQALAYALPREAINQKIYQGLRRLAVGFFPKSSRNTSPKIKPITLDLSKAQKLLASEGWKKEDGSLKKDGKTLKFQFLTMAGAAEADRILLMFQRNLKSLGIEMSIVHKEATSFMEDINKRKFDASGMRWRHELLPDPYVLFHSAQDSPNGGNTSGLRNKQVDKLLEEARVELNEQKRYRLYQKLSEILHDEQPFLFMFEYPALQVVSKRFKNVTPIGPMGTHPFFWKM
jgi:peptide/nickel transport system substrate-binding protein